MVREDNVEFLLMSLKRKMAEVIVGLGFLRLGLTSLERNQKQVSYPDFFFVCKETYFIKYCAFIASHLLVAVVQCTGTLCWAFFPLQWIQYL